MKTGHISIVLLAFAVFSSVRLSADGTYGDGYPFFVERTADFCPWLLSGNVSGNVFTFADSLNMSFAEIFRKDVSGGFKRYYEPERYGTSGFRTASAKTIGNLFVRGRFDYGYTGAKGHAWCGTVVPEEIICFMADSVPGKTAGESYNTSVGLSLALSDVMAAGVSFDYDVGTLSKFNDGRNSNTRSALGVSPSLAFRYGKFVFGGALTYERVSEKVSYKYIGDPAGKGLYYFEGLFYYTFSPASSSFLSERWYYNEAFGGSLQCSASSGDVDLYGEISLKYRMENDYQDNLKSWHYNEVLGLDWSYTGNVLFRRDRFRHVLKMDFENLERMSYNVLNVYEPVPGENNQYRYREYGRTLRYASRFLTAGMSYVFYADADLSGHGKWRTVTGYSFALSDEEFMFYPVSSYRKYFFHRFAFRADRTFYSYKGGVSDIGAGAVYRCGYGSFSSSDGFLSSGSFRQNTGLLESEHMYNDSENISVLVRISHMHDLKPHGKLSLYGTLEAGAVFSQSLHMSRRIFSIAAGFYF